MFFGGITKVFMVGSEKDYEIIDENYEQVKAIIYA